MTATLILGEGILNWFTFERQSDRYGAIHLETTPGVYATFPNAREGAKGTLVATVTQTRPSGHIGDLFRGIGPSEPEIGEPVELGTGKLFTYLEQDIPVIGVEPEDGRDDDWMDPRALYRCHNQTVRLAFVAH